MTTEASALSSITTETIRDLLCDPKVFPGLPADLGADTELALDSLGLVWLLHVVEHRYGLVVEPTDADLDGFTSIQRITDYLRGAAATTGGSDGL